ncbi:MAG: helix-turn-helix domain-containing protein [Candidatus Magasanikbacteria bacterium]
MQLDTFKKLGFSDKGASIYVALLSLGPSSVRKLAEFCGLNRGTTYDTLKWLQSEGVVEFYQKDAKQYFVAENPEKLLDIVKKRDEELHEAQKEVSRMIPELLALHNKGGERPVARYYQKEELKEILEDVLHVCEETDEKKYQIYSTEEIRECLYKDFPTFSDVRVSKGIRVQVIAIGEGGELRGLDERKWLDPLHPLGTSPHKGEGHTAPSATYIIIYPGKTAYISLDAKAEPVGVVIENQGVYETQKLIFDNLWNSL